MTRVSILDKSDTTAPKSSSLGWRGCWRLNVRSCRVSAAVDQAAKAIAAKRPAPSTGVPENATALPKAKLQVLSGAFAGREVELSKALTTLGRPGVQVAAITRRAEGYFIVHVDSGKENDYPQVNGVPIGPQARRLNDNDVVQLAGVKMGFFES